MRLQTALRLLQMARAESQGLGNQSRQVFSASTRERCQVGCAAPVQSRLFHALSQCFSIDIIVPSMGDSITEGSIASILKEAGSSVAEDEPVLQIETDKVTIDVRAPSSGVLRALLVKEDEAVVVGQVVAVLDEATDAAVTPSSLPASETGMSLEEKSDKAFDKPFHALRRPLISFPPRRSPDGQIISAMPVVDQTTYKARSSAARPPASPKIGAIYVAAAPEKRRMSDWEMECINLGGAA